MDNRDAVSVRRTGATPRYGLLCARGSHYDELNGIEVPSRDLYKQFITKTVNGLIELITNSKNMTIHSVHLSHLLQGIANSM